MPCALIIGHTGQDGRLLQEQLAGRGYGVVGVSRSVDLGDAVRIAELVVDAACDEVYYLAAHHHSSQDPGIHDPQIWRDSWNVHVHGFGHLLAALAEHSPNARVFYASSSRIFGRSAKGLLDEDAPRRPEDPYGLTKTGGMMLADYYRRVHGLFVSCGILFNHESPLRGTEFVTQRVVQGLVAIQRGRATSLEIGSLEARADWGYAPDYTRAMQMMLALDEPGDFVVATGESHSVRELVEIAAGLIGIEWRGCVREAGGLLTRPPQALCGNAARLRNATGWKPTVDFRTLVERMVAAAVALPA